VLCNGCGPGDDYYKCPECGGESRANPTRQEIMKNPIDLSDELEDFARAFKYRVSKDKCVCACGREFSGFVQSSSDTLEYGIVTLGFEGREYVEACDCWHPRATELVAFIESHARRFAQYLALAKQRKQARADRAPTLES
jgi:hypothetical protein